MNRLLYDLVAAIREATTSVFGLPCLCGTPELHEPHCLKVRLLVSRADYLAITNERGETS